MYEYDIEHFIDLDRLTKSTLQTLSWQVDEWNLSKVKFTSRSTLSGTYHINNIFLKIY